MSPTATRATKRATKRPTTPEPLLAPAPNAWRMTDLHGRPTNGLRVVSTFACGGGSSLGYKLAGCTVVGANDIDPDMAWHYQKNIAPPHYHLGPIRDLLTLPIPDAWRDLDILDGSPPCSAFSVASTKRKEKWGTAHKFREGQAEQVLTDLFFDFLAVGARLTPKVIVAENVPGMLSGAAVGYARKVVRELTTMGYRVQVFKLNAADCGVPQRRHRVFFLAMRQDLNAPPLTLAPRKPWVTAADAVRDLTPTALELASAQPDATDRAWWHITRPGEGYDKAVERTTARKLWNKQKLSPTRPACTLTASHSMFTHWATCRQFTATEYRRLGAFPDDYVSKTEDLGKYLVGMSVPPFLTAHVARAIAQQWFRVDIPDDALTARFW